MKVLVLIIIGFLIVGCGKKQSTITSENNNPSVNKEAKSDVDALADRIVEHNKVRRKVYVDILKDKRIWSDKVFIEIGEKFPAAIEEMIKAPTGQIDMKSYIIKLELNLADEWSEAEIETELDDFGNYIVRSKSSEKFAVVSPLYIDYINARFPESKFLAKNSTSPVVVTIDGEICAAIMPLRKRD